MIVCVVDGVVILVKSLRLCFVLAADAKISLGGVTYFQDKIMFCLVFDPYLFAFLYFVSIWCFLESQRTLKTAKLVLCLTSLVLPVEGHFTLFYSSL